MLLAVGRCRNPYLKAGVSDYIERIGRYASLKHIELKEERTPKKGAAHGSLGVEPNAFSAAYRKEPILLPWILPETFALPRPSHAG